MTTVGMICTLILELAALFGVISPIILAMKKLTNGTKCQLRDAMLRIYYHHSETKVVRQYEYENFVLLYEAYKALKGNSFIDKIYTEVKTWEIIS